MFDPKVISALSSAVRQIAPVQTTFNGSDGQDTITVKPAHNGGVNVTVNGESYYVPKDKVKDIVINAGNGKDTVTVDPRVTQGITINGGNGDDTIQGGSGRDRINGGNGSDTIYGGKGADVIDGGNGHDHIYGGDGLDTIKESAGNDHVNYGGPNTKGFNFQELVEWLRGKDGVPKGLEELLKFLSAGSIR